MTDPEKWKEWKQRGSISLWHYEGFPKNYRGYHLTADREGCEFLLGLIGLFWNEGYPARKKIILDAPTPAMLAVPNCGLKCIPAGRLELCFLRDQGDGHWSVTGSEGEVIIETGANGLKDLERGIMDISHGQGDWAMGSGKESLWFWW